MSIRVLNLQGDQIVISPQTKTALASLARDASKPDADWDEITHKMYHVLEGDGFEIDKLQAEVSYFDSKKGRQATNIDIYYAE